MSRRPRLPLALLAALCLALVAVGCSSNDDDAAAADPSEAALPEGIEVRDATIDWPANPTTAAVRMVVVNGGPADELISVTSPVADHTSIHRSEVDDEGRSTMVEQDGVEVPARSSVFFAPSLQHVMLSGITEDLQVGDDVALVLTFRDAGTVRATATVIEPGSADGDGEDDGGDHGH